MSNPPSTDQTYPFGYDPEEIERLQNQGRLFNGFTRRLFEDAGISTGMAVLDVGCGPGEVSLIIGALVGPEGHVLGVDVNPAALQVAQARAQAAGFGHVSFLAGDLQTLALDPEFGTFDAIVGRFILQHLSDPVALLRVLAQRLRPGGVVAFQEYDLTGPVAYPPCPLWEQAGNWCVDALRAAGREVRMGIKLASTYLAAGLPIPRMRHEAIMGAGPDWEGYAHLANTVRSLLPLIVRYGIASADEIGIETLADRLRAQVVSQGAAARLSGVVSAWAQTDVGRMSS